VQVLVALLLPAFHPLLTPFVGVPSHLLWWVHVRPVAITVFRRGRLAAVGMLLVSTTLLISFERMFGSGFSPTDWTTVLSLAVALALTNVLVSSFALHARSVTLSYHQLFHASKSAVLRVDDKGHVISVNPAAEKLLATPSGELEGRLLGSIGSLACLPPVDVLVGSSWSGRMCDDASESPRETYVTATATRAGETGEHQILLFDRTLDVAQEREIERQGRLSTLGESLAGVAHELKNPLQVIITYAQLGKHAEGISKELASDLAAIDEQASKMNRLISELLGFSRRRERAERFLVHELVRRTAAVHRVTHRGHIEIEEDVRWRGAVTVSEPKVEQVLTNLISNAADAVDERSGTVRISVERKGDRVRLTVSDNGAGIAADDADRIFEPFRTTKPEGQGTGLGLPISRKLTQSMGGDLLLVAGQGDLGGAEFALEIPLTEGTA
jgi:nitrogen fixation/metabolism regulation signal transduction histidine kinase